MDAASVPVTLRPLQAEDGQVLATWATDVEFCLVAGWRVGLSRAEYQRFHERLIASPPDDLLRLAATYDDELVGYVDLHGTEEHRRELGFVIGDSSRWGRGLGRSAAAAGLDHAFDVLGLDEIWAEAFDAHGRSVNILTGLGMTEVGRGTDGMFLGEPTFYRRFVMRKAT